MIAGRYALGCEPLSDQIISGNAEPGVDLLPDRVWIRYHDRRAIQQKLRISLVDKCNLSCFFCHNEGQGPIKKISSVSLDTSVLQTIVRVAVSEGVNKIKLTGGEPLLYKSTSSDIVDVISRISDLRRNTSPFDLSITTNGTLLPHMASQLASAGLDRVTVSLTTTNLATFGEFISTRTHLLSHMITGIDKAREAGLQPLKLNIPLYYSSGRHAGNLYEIDRLIGFATSHGVNEVRFFTLISHSNFLEFDEYYHFFSSEMRSSLIQCLSHHGLDSPTETVDVLARLGSKFAGKAYPKVEFGVNLGRVSLAFEAMKYGRLGTAQGHQEGPYAMRLSADGSLRSVLGSSPSYLLIDAINRGESDETLREIYRATQGEMP